MHVFCSCACKSLYLSLRLIVWGSLQHPSSKDSYHKYTCTCTCMHYKTKFTTQWFYIDYKLLSKHLALVSNSTLSWLMTLVVVQYAFRFIYGSFLPWRWKKNLQHWAFYTRSPKHDCRHFYNGCTTFAPAAIAPMIHANVERKVFQP